MIFDSSTSMKSFFLLNADNIAFDVNKTHFLEFIKNPASKIDGKISESFLENMLHELPREMNTC